jgi:cholesterol oxidase
MRRLSQSIGRLESDYDVVVIGSGYGGAIAASRMARAGLNVCLLERGREFALGDFPSSIWRGLWDIQLNQKWARLGRSLGLIEVHRNPDVNAIVGCGLGGTSLINAGVALKPDPRLWNDARWPTAIRNDLRSVAAGYFRAKQMLRPRPLPMDFGALRKLSALHESATVLNLGREFYRPPINVTFEDGVNRAGIQQIGCTACGDCVSGCNEGAKNTTAMNYLPDAVNHGAAIFTQVEARWIKRGEGKWIVGYRLIGVGRERFAAPELFVLADLVIVAAGAIGSTALLLRSRDQQRLSMSDRVGERFTGNGDVLGFAYNTDQAICSVGFGANPKGRFPDVGPCITGIIDHRRTQRLRDGFVIEEGAFPGAIDWFLPLLMWWFDVWVGKTVLMRDRLKAFARIARSILGLRRGALQRTQIYLVMAHDDAEGKLELEDDRPRISWPKAGSQPIFEKIKMTLRRATKALGGDFVENPLWSKDMGRALVTVHPLGGCPMGDRAENAVVDHTGCVFSGAAGEAVHGGLHVVDGAIVPMSLGVNPLLTISALAERCCALIAKDRGRVINYAAALASAWPRSAQNLGLSFTEAMRGAVSINTDRGFLATAPLAESGGAPIEFMVTIVSDDLKTMLDEEAHEAAIIGTLSCPALAEGAMTITQGRFNLFVAKSNNSGVREMVYRMSLCAPSGETFYLHGVKIIKPGPPLNAWKDTTTLHATIFRGSQIVGGGDLHLAFRDFLRQLTTFQVTNALSLSARLGALASFGMFFARVLFTTYGRLFSPR